MTDVNLQSSNEPGPTKSRLPSPGCLFAISLLAIAASVCFLLGWRAHQRQARIAYFERLGAKVHTEPARPLWAHDLVSDLLSSLRNSRLARPPTCMRPASVVAV